jgi:hypothetical protein
MNKRQRKKQIAVSREKVLRACYREALAEPDAVLRAKLLAELRALRRARRWPPHFRIGVTPDARATAFPLSRPGAVVYVIEQSFADLERLYGRVRQAPRDHATLSCTPTLIIPDSQGW